MGCCIHTKSTMAITNSIATITLIDTIVFGRRAMGWW